MRQMKWFASAIGFGTVIAYTKATAEIMDPPDRATLLVPQPFLSPRTVRTAVGHGRRSTETKYRTEEVKNQTVIEMEVVSLTGDGMLSFDFSHSHSGYRLKLEPMKRLSGT